MITLLLFLMTGSASPSSATDRAWAVLKEGLSNQSAMHRTKAVHALGLAGRSTQSLAEKALSDTDKEVRSEAATALQEMNAITARPKLRACLKDPVVEVVLSCASALYQFKDPAAYEIYFALLTGERRTHEGLVQSQMDTLHDRKQMEKLAFETGIGFVPFGGMTWQAIKTIAHDDATPIRALAAERLAKDSDRGTTQALEKYAFDKKPQVREAVLISIAHRGDVGLLNTVETMLADDNEGIRYEAAATIIALTKR